MTIAAKNCPVYLIDASIYFFRSYFALPDNWHSVEGNPTNGLFGFTSWCLKLLQQQSPVLLAAAFDESLGSGFRHRLSPDYKVSRALPDELLAFQLNACRQVAELLGIAHFASDEHEADDIVGSLGKLARSEGRRVTFVSGDKDLAQLLATGDTLWDFGRSDAKTPADIAADFGVTTGQIADYLALVGDSIDNIAGVPGIGPKTAAAMLQHYKSIDELLNNLDALSRLPVRGAAGLAEKITTHRQQLLLARRLTGIYCDIPLVENIAELHWQGIELDDFGEFCQRMGLGERLFRQAGELAGQSGKGSVA